MIHSVETVHYDEVYVSVGQTVTKGQKLGRFGNTGDSTGPHVHMTIIPQAWTDPVNRWGIGEVLDLGGTRQMIMNFLDDLTAPLLQRDGVPLEYYISPGGGWWGTDSSYFGHYAIDLIPVGSQTPYPDVVWSSDSPGTIVAVNKTDRDAGLWIIATYDTDVTTSPGTKMKKLPFLYVPRPIW